MVLTHRQCPEEGPAETVLPLATPEVQPSTGAAGHLVHCHCSVCPVFVHLSVVLFIHKTGQVQAAMKSHVCRENHQGYLQVGSTELSAKTSGHRDTFFPQGVYMINTYILEVVSHYPLCKVPCAYMYI
ncbi:hypothetical protein AMECASPLE_038391 [Ameca splendens]|uniref:Uncharacterized protein n=1 Tax=Ameca splendens TaxID=208324 RepID=A0ABV0Z623_9TELE